MGGRGLLFVLLFYDVKHFGLLPSVLKAMYKQSLIDLTEEEMCCSVETS